MNIEAVWIKFPSDSQGFSGRTSRKNIDIEGTLTSKGWIKFLNLSSYIILYYIYIIIIIYIYYIYIIYILYILLLLLLLLLLLKDTYNNPILLYEKLIQTASRCLDVNVPSMSMFSLKIPGSQKEI